MRNPNPNFHAHDPRAYGNSSSGEFEKRLSADPAFSLFIDTFVGFEQAYYYFEEILCIDCCPPNKAFPRGLIKVRTRLGKGNSIPDLPSEYAGIPVVQEPLGEELNLWRNTWTQVFKFLFDLNDDSLSWFLLRQEGIFINPWFLHDGPFDVFPMQVFARYAFAHHDGIDMKKVGEEIFEAFAGEHGPDRDWYPQLDADFDWPAARIRAYEVINIYRKKLDLQPLVVPK